MDVCLSSAIGSEGLALAAYLRQMRSAPPVVILTAYGTVEVAREALKRNAGARGLRAIMEKSMLDIMYDVPSQADIREVVVSEEVIASGEKPLIVYEKEEAELA